MKTHLRAAFAALAFGAVPATGQTPSPEPVRIIQLQQWIAAVRQHTPGTTDAAVAGIRAWNRESLQNVWDDLSATRTLLCERCPAPPHAAKAKTDYVTSGGRPGWRTTYATDHLAALKEFTARVQKGGDINDLLKRGALLHTDIALRAPPIVTWAPTATYRPLQRAIVSVADGQQGGVDEAVDHLEMARRLLELVTADPRTDLRTSPQADQTVRSWYRATLGFLLGRRQLDDTHVRAALQLLPDDASVLFLAAAFHETRAAPRVQNAVVTRSFAGMSVVESPATELRRAEEYFRRALELNPEHFEARLRLGQVLGRLGRHADALVELRASTANSDSLLAYYANLLAGREEDALGNVMGARAAYERAAQLYPRAQTPLLSLSEIDMRSGNRAGAEQWLRPVLTARVPPPLRDDPWTSYFEAAGRNGSALLTAIGAEFPPSARQ
jgi:tetratricopeptide (TPR) repeat protein